MSNDSQLLREIRDRMVRTESRLISLADGVGVNIRSKRKIELVCMPMVVPFIVVEGMDTSLGQIISTCHEQGISGILVDVFCNDHMIGSVQT